LQFGVSRLERIYLSLLQTMSNPLSGAMLGLRACVKKELLLLSRDMHGLALLLHHAAAFILIMSLALQNQFAERAGSN